MLLTGLPGAHRDGAADINTARDATARTQERVLEARDSRLKLADDRLARPLLDRDPAGHRAAVDGSSSLGPAGTDSTGLSRMAETLRSEMTGFLGVMRG
ncbi:hypothetical protein [Modestobacter sp. SYSU DS0875]